MTTPNNWTGSLPELAVFQELLRRGLEHGVDFFFQSPIFGGRTQRGGYVIDFFFVNPPNLAINVQGVYYHYQRGRAQRAHDELVRARMAGRGIHLVFIDEDDVERDVRGVVGDALRFIDRSRLGS